MKRASISETKNHLSRLLDDVKGGESILILDRNKPVATIEPYREAGLRDLVRDGIVSPAREELDVAAFLSLSGPKLPPGVSGSAVLAAEREEGL